jgi:hypothetical protein
VACHFAKDGDYTENQEISKRLGKKWKNLYPTLKENLRKKYPALYIPDYPIVHGLGHSERMEKYLTNILMDIDLPQIEGTNLFILLAGIWLHDTGYGVDANQLMEEGKIPKEKIDTSEDRLIIQDKYHNILSAWFAENRLDDLIGRLSVTDNIKKLIALLCKLHRRSSGSILDGCQNAVTNLNGETINVPLLVALLRLIDALDIDSRRISDIDEKIQKLPEKIKDRPFWKACGLIDSVRLRGEKKSIIIEGTVRNWEELQLLKWKIDDLYDEIIRLRNSKLLSRLTKPIVYNRVFAKVHNQETDKFHIFDVRSITSFSYDSGKYLKRCPKCYNRVEVIQDSCKFCGNPFFIAYPLVLENWRWEKYWDERLNDLKNTLAAPSSPLIITKEAEKRLQQLIEKVQIQTKSLEKGALLASSALINGVFTKQELIILGEILSRHLGLSYLPDQASDAFDSLIKRKSLVSAKTTPDSGKDLYLLRYLDDFGITFREIEPDCTNIDEEIRNLLRAFAKSKTNLSLWVLLENGIPKSLMHQWQKTSYGGVLKDNEEYNKKSLDLITNAESEIRISLEYGTGITKEPYNLLMEKLKKGVKVRICIAPTSNSCTLSEAMSEWQETNTKLRELASFGDVMIFETPELDHKWHILMSLKNDEAEEVIGFYRLGCLPFLHAPTYADKQTDRAYLDTMMKNWEEMVKKHTLKMYPPDGKIPKWVTNLID